MEANECLGVARVWRDYERECWHVLQTYPNAHVCVSQVDLCNVDGAEGWVSKDDATEEAVKGSAELHSLRRGMEVHCLIYSAEGVVVDQAVTPVRLRDGADG